MAPLPAGAPLVEPQYLGGLLLRRAEGGDAHANNSAAKIAIEIFFHVFFFRFIC